MTIEDKSFVNEKHHASEEYIEDAQRRPSVADEITELSGIEATAASSAAWLITVTVSLGNFLFGESSQHDLEYSVKLTIPQATILDTSLQSWSPSASLWAMNSLPANRNLSPLSPAAVLSSALSELASSQIASAARCQSGLPASSSSSARSYRQLRTRSLSLPWDDSSLGLVSAPQPWLSRYTSANLHQRDTAVA